MKDLENEHEIDGGMAGITDFQTVLEVLSKPKSYI